MAKSFSSGLYTVSSGCMSMGDWYFPEQSSGKISCQYSGPGNGWLELAIGRIACLVCLSVWPSVCLSVRQNTYLSGSLSIQVRAVLRILVFCTVRK